MIIGAKKGATKNTLKIFMGYLLKMLFHLNIQTETGNIQFLMKILIYSAATSLMFVTRQAANLNSGIFP